MNLYQQYVDRYFVHSERMQLNKTVGLNLNNMAAAKHSLYYCLLRNNEILS